MLMLILIYRCAPLHTKAMKGACAGRQNQSLYQTPFPSTDRLAQTGMIRWIGKAFRDIRNKLETDKIANCEVRETRNYTSAKFTHVKYDH